MLILVPVEVVSERLFHPHSSFGTGSIVVIVGSMSIRRKDFLCKTCLSTLPSNCWWSNRVNLVIDQETQLNSKAKIPVMNKRDYYNFAQDWAVYAGFEISK